MGRFEREIETRMKKLDVFRDDFDSPSPAFNESDVVDSVKKSGPYGKKHNDTIPEADPSFGLLAASGKPEDQEPMDAMDRDEQRYQSRIKDNADQFPMKGGIMGPDEFQKKCEEKEKSMKRMGSATYRGVNYAIQSKGKYPSTMYYSEIEGERFDKNYYSSAQECGRMARQIIDQHIKESGEGELKYENKSETKMSGGHVSTEYRGFKIIATEESDGSWHGIVLNKSGKVIHENKDLFENAKQAVQQCKSEIDRNQV